MDLSPLHHRALIAFCEGVLFHVKKNNLQHLEAFHQIQLHFLLNTRHDFRLIFDRQKPDRLTFASETLLVDFFDSVDEDKKAIMIRTPE